MTLFAEYEDVGSSVDANRPGFQQALRSAERGDYDILLVQRLDRLTFECWFAVELLRRLEDIGVAVMDLSDGFDSSTPSDKEFVRVLLEHVESDDIEES